MFFLKKILDKHTKPVYAHCDVPCGIYDPISAQIAAHTVIRMTQLIEENKDNEHHDIARYTATKEEHSEKVKHEIRILMGDYFLKFIEKYPELNELSMKVMKLGSQTKQNIDINASEELLETVNKIAEIFWTTKNIETFRAKAPYPTEKETVYPKLG